jgi:hypothetical protein
MPKPTPFAWTPDATNPWHDDLQVLIPAWEGTGTVKELVNNIASTATPSWAGNTPTFTGNATWDSVPVNLSNQYTVVFYAYFTTPGGYNGFRFGPFANLGLRDDRFIVSNSSTNNARAYVQDGGVGGKAVANLGSANDPFDWTALHLIEYQRDGDTIRIYIDGVLEVTNTGWGTAAFGSQTNQLRFGRTSQTGADPATTVIEAMYVWDRHLTSSERTALVADPWEPIGFPNVDPDGSMNVTSAAILASGTEIELGFGTDATYFLGDITVRMPLPTMGETQERSLRLITPPKSGNGTDTLVFDLQTEKPIFAGETGIEIDLEVNTFWDEVDKSNEAQPSFSVTNNSALTGCEPLVRVAIPRNIYSGETWIEAQAFPILGGVSKVELSVTDGTTTLGPVEVTTPTASEYLAGGYVCFRSLFDLDLLLPVELTVTAEAFSDSGLGSRTTTQNIYNCPVLPVVYVADSGDDSTGDGTSGNPYKTIGEAATQARALAIAAGSIGAEIRINEAGEYPANAGRRFPNFGSDSGGFKGEVLKITGTGTADVVVIPGSADTLRVEQGVFIVWDDILLSPTIRGGTNAGLDGQIVDDACFLPGCVARGGGATNGGTGTGVIFSEPADNYNFGATFEDMRSFGGVSWSRGGLLRRQAGDAFFNCRFAADNINLDRKFGPVAFEIAYTGSGVARFSKTGIVTDAGGTGIWTLTVDDVAVASFDSEDSDFNTYTKLVAAIDAVTDWSATLINSGSISSGLSVYFDIPVTSTPVEIHNTSSFHSDFFQLFGTYFENIIWHNNLGVGTDLPGLGGYEQTFWIHHTTPIEVNGLAAIGNIDWQPFVPTGPIPRSGFHADMSNVIVANNTFPGSKLHLNYSADLGRGLRPVNIHLARNIWYWLDGEGGNKSSVGDLGVYEINNHFRVTRDEEDTNTTIGDPDTEFVEYGPNLPFDFAPSEGSVFLDRIGATVKAWDRDGNQLVTGGAIGAVQEAGDPPAGTVEELFVQVTVDGRLDLSSARLAGLWDDSEPVTVDLTKITLLTQDGNPVAVTTLESTQGIAGGGSTVRAFVNTNPVLFSEANGDIAIEVAEGFFIDAEGNRSGAFSSADLDNSSTQEPGPVEPPAPPAVVRRPRLTGGSAATFRVRIT